MTKMINAILLKVDGKLEAVQVGELKDYWRLVGGNVTLLASMKKVKLGNKSYCPTAYVNDEGMMNGMALNPWSIVLPQLGFAKEQYFGPILMFGNGKAGNDTSIDSEVKRFLLEHEITDES